MLTWLKNAWSLSGLFPIKMRKPIPLQVAVLTLFPELVEPNFKASILKRARQKGLFEPKVLNIRDFARNKHLTVDDKPYGGGAGMVLQIGPVARAIRVARKQLPKAKVYLLSPTGKRFDQHQAGAMAKARSFILLCGHYEGLDQRIHDHLVDEELSIGDYVLTGGEPAAIVVIDAVARLIPMVLGDEASSRHDSFMDGLLDYPHYTRPPRYGPWRVPDILLTGHHHKVVLWRRREQLKRTLTQRPDLLENVKLSESDRDMLERLKTEISQRKGKGRRMV